eukprot:10115667-Heterocapsa_arctica.AAC.1
MLLGLRGARQGSRAHVARSPRRPAARQWLGREAEAARAGVVVVLVRTAGQNKTSSLERCNASQGRDYTESQ